MRHDRLGAAPSGDPAAREDATGLVDQVDVVLEEVAAGQAMDRVGLDTEVLERQAGAFADRVLARTATRISAPLGSGLNGEEAPGSPSRSMLWVNTLAPPAPVFASTPRIRPRPLSWNP